MKRQIKDFGKDLLAKVHRLGLPLGLSILPNHYYTPIADQRRLSATRQHWSKRAELRGVDVSIADQAEWLMANVGPFELEFRGNTNYLDGMAKGYGPGYGYIEAQCLHGVIRALKPRRIIEIGSGVSTYCALSALARNAAEGSPGLITCVEPYPSDFLRANQAITLVESPVESLNADYFDSLEAGDLLFIDSTHAVRPGGDVIYIYLSILPRLKPGVFVHIHDIYLPYLYQRDLVGTIFQSNETALLAALLTGNPHFRILCALSMMHYDAPDRLKAVFPEYRHQPGDEGLMTASTGHFPSSIYLQTV
jgi:predicted O-methyltransferase YrrM